MKLIYRIIIRLSLLLTLVLGLWASFFYITMIDEINDEVDDALEDYSEQIIVRSLAGEELPSNHSNSNNQYYLNPVSPDYASGKPHLNYLDSMVYIAQKREYEPARVLSTIYKDANNQYHELVVMTPNFEKQDLQEAIFNWVVILYLTLLFVVLTLTIWVYYGSTRPLYRLLTWLDNYQIGGVNKPLNNPTEITEFRKLNEAAVRNLKRAEEVFEHQREFIGNASHEMQTPLAVCSNRLETLMEDESLSEQQLTELAKTHQTLEYLSKLNKTLLLLSKIDNNQFLNKTELNINSLVSKISQDYAEVYAYKNISLEIKELGQLKVVMDETIAGVLINNLLKNSYVHNISGGTVVIEVSASKLIVRNTSEHGALDSDLIFDRFYQGTKKDGSTGLGLALVSSVVKAENLRINYFYKNDMHGFEINFKK